MLFIYFTIKNSFFFFCNEWLEKKIKTHGDWKKKRDDQATWNKDLKN